MRLPFLLATERAAFQQLWPSPLREADVDDIEVLRDHRLGEDGPRLADDLGPEVAVREVC
jgi:hypothetical protein